MTFYRKEIEKLKKSFYPHDDLTKQIRRSKIYIDKHFSENISLDKIASEALVSKFHFIRVFKKYYGRTPNKYLQEARIEKSKRLLEKKHSIDEVCIAVGFASKTSFISLFRRMTGETPSVYQNGISKKAILKNG